MGKAQKKIERSREIKSKMDSLKQERLSKSQGMNLFVKNIDDTVTDEQFREAFAPYGTISSARIMKDEQTGSKGFGFVCFSSPEEANRAMTEMNGKMLKSKPLVVTIHQRRDVRRAQLVANYGRRVNFPGGQAPMMYPGMMFPQGAQPYMPTQGGPQRFPNMPFPGRGMNQQPGRGMFPTGRGYPMPPYVMANGQQPGRAMPMPSGGRGMPPMMMMGPGGRDGGRGMRSQPGRGQQGRGPMQPPMPQAGRGQNVKFTSQARNQSSQMMPMPMSMQPPMMPSMAPMGMNNDALALDQMLAQADPQTQKNMIGERLYPLILEKQPGQAGKITGMLLEMDNAELLHLIESPDALTAKVEEALDVLRKHQGEN